MQYDFVEVDDPEFASRNAHVRAGLTAETIGWAFTESHASNWLPLTFLSLALDSQLFGTGPEGYHRTNVLLHALAAALLFLALRRLTGATWRALAVAALWAVHPLRVESVAWIAERKDVLSAVFAFGALWSYAVGVETGRRAAKIATAVLLALGLLAKGMLVTLPFVMLLLDHWPLRRTEPLRTRIVEKLPLFALVVADAVATFLAQRAGGAVSDLRTLDFAQRATNAIVSYARYLGDLFWPGDMAYLYPHPAFRPPDFGWSALAVFASAGLILAISAALLWLDRRRDLRYPLVGWLIFLGMLVPVLGLLQVGVQSMADRYTYLPHIGLIVAVVWAAGALAERQRAVRPLVHAAGVALFVAACAGTRAQLPTWRDSEALFSHAVEVTEDNAYALNGLGAILAQRGDVAGARPHLERAVALDPALADARVNLGIVLAASGDSEGALREYRAALRRRPDMGIAHMNLGSLLAAQGDLDRAESHLRSALADQSHRWQVHYNLGRVLLAQGKRTEARQSLRQALALDPGNESVRAALAALGG